MHLVTYLYLYIYIYLSTMHLFTYLHILFIYFAANKLPAQLARCSQTLKQDITS